MHMLQHWPHPAATPLAGPLQSCHQEGLFGRRCQQYLRHCLCASRFSRPLNLEERQVSLDRVRTP